MRKESINKVKEVMKQLGITALHMQGDNSNYFSDGTERNAIIFDDTNEIAWALRVNDNYGQPGGAYKITAFDYEHVQYLVMEANLDKVAEFIDIIAPEADKAKLKEVFKQHSRDKGLRYKPNPGRVDSSKK